ncbi:MAG: heavy metal response regulator transcription factor [Thermoanaerobaculia bacterium]
MRLLIIEDEAKTASYLSKGLKEAGFVLDVAADGEDGLHLALTGSYDLVILDVMLPGLDGWDVIRKLRDAKEHLPVIFLTARDSVEDRVKGLELQADDYLVKPFAFTELIARIRTVLRRAPQRVQQAIKVADLEIDLIRHRAVRQGNLLNLTPKEFSLLSLLVRRAGEILPRAVIAEQVWDINFDTDTNIIDVAVRRLRSKVDDPFEQKLIHTVRGMGYVLEAR